MDDLNDFLSPVIEQPKEKEPEKIKKHGLFDYIKDLSNNKKLLAFEDEMIDGKFPSEVSPYMINKAFGNFYDTVIFANEMNLRSQIPVKALYLFYTYGISKKTRYASWYKEDTSNKDKLEALMKYFNWSSREASINIHMFTDDQLNEIIGVCNNERSEKTSSKRRTGKKPKPNR